MKKLDLQPTETNLLETYLNDSIGRVPSIHSFVNLLESIEGGCSIAVDSPWGNGKTFFVKQTKMVIDTLNPNNPYSSTNTGKEIQKKCYKALGLENRTFEPFITTYYDAWEHDDEEDPILSLVYEMMQENYCITKIPNKRDWSDIISKLADTVTKLSISSLVSSVKGENLFERPKNNTELRNIINVFFESLLPENGNKLVVFIDELDRCSPTYAIKLLERIKHYMLNDSVIFVFSINQIELQHTIRKFYGDNFDACRYLDRFFDFRIELPEVDYDEYISSLGLSGHKNMRETTCFEFIKLANISLREMPKYISATRMATFAVTDGNNSDNICSFNFGRGNTMLIAFSVIVPVAIGLRITNMDEYRKFVCGKSSIYLENVILSDSLFSWIIPLLLEDKVNYIRREELTDEAAREKIKNLYEAIFIKTYDNGAEYETKVGKLTIDKTVKKMIMEAVNLTSKYTDCNQ